MLTQHVLYTSPLWTPHSKSFLDFIAIFSFVRFNVGWPDPLSWFKEGCRMCEVLFWCGGSFLKKISFLWDISLPCLLWHAVLGCSPIVSFQYILDAGICLMLCFSMQVQSCWTDCSLANFSISLSSHGLCSNSQALLVLTKLLKTLLIGCYRVMPIIRINLLTHPKMVHYVN